ncbi:MAG TPA: hypothetical protein VGK58_17610 [Lacipirellulaceae bacterium]
MGKFQTGLLCSIGAVVVGVAFIYASSARSDAPANHSPDLLERVASLESRVAELEKRLDQTLFQYQRPVTNTAGPIVDLLLAPTSPLTPSAIAPSLQKPSGIPPDLAPHYFNGATYYLVPLTKETSK